MRKFLALSSLLIFFLSLSASDILQECSGEHSSTRLSFSRSDIPHGSTSDNTIHRDDAGEEESRCRARTRIIFQTGESLSERKAAVFIKSGLYRRVETVKESRICTQLLNQRAPPLKIIL